MAKREWISKEHKIFRTPKGDWYARPSIPGLGRKEIALGRGITTLKQAVKAKERMVAVLLRRNEPVRRELVRFETLAQEVISLKIVKSQATLDSAELHFTKHLIPWFNDHYPYVTEVNEASWEEYIVAQYAINPTRKLFNDRKHMAMVMRHAYRKGLVTRPMLFRNPDPERKAGKRLSDDEVTRLFLAAGPALKTQILLAVTMGMRKSEILKLTWDRIDFVRKTIHLRAADTKIRKARTMGMPARVAAALASSRDGSSPFVFPSRYSTDKATKNNKTAWNACKRRAKVTSRFHDLRHTFLSVALLERKLNPLHVAVYAGVSLAEIQRTYLHPSVEDTREVGYDLGGKMGVASK